MQNYMVMVQTTGISGHNSKSSRFIITNTSGTTNALNAEANYNGSVLKEQLMQYGG